MPTSPAEDRYDVAVLGAGPAGLAAAVSASQAGARVALLDSAARPGGQYWRNRGEADSGALHHDWSTFRALRGELRDRIDHLARHAVWRAERDAERLNLHATCDGAERIVRASALVLATGAYDRQLPFPGWTLPGVFTAGGVQALLKGHGVLAGRRIAVAGTGPFLLAVAAGLAQSGADVVGVFEAGHPAEFARFPGVLARNAAKLTEGARYLATLARHRIPYRPRTAVIAAHGSGELNQIVTARLTREWQVVPGSETPVDCDTLAVGYGFTPQLEIPLQLGCDTRLDVDGSLVAIADNRQRSTRERVYLAGEVCGVAGAAASVAEGRLAGLAAAEDVLAAAPDPQQLRRLHRQRESLRSFARAMHAAFPVPTGWISWVTPDTTICRCEEVDARTVEAAIEELGAADPRAVKLYARPGMGLCQGRVCGYATTCLLTARGGRTPTADDLRSMSARPIANPITLGTIAAGQRTEPGVKPVDASSMELESSSVQCHMRHVIL